MSKLVGGMLMLKDGSAPAGTSDIDKRLKAWVTGYVEWLTTADLALESKAATNNHGSFHFNQLAALQVLVGDTSGAKKTIQGYFAGIYMNQISANGDQPLETSRNRPYHYRAHNLAAMSAGVTIQDACNYAMTFAAASSNETAYDPELYPNVATVAAIYGDPDGKYAQWLAGRDSSSPGQPYFLWDQPLGNADLIGEPTGGVDNERVKLYRYREQFQQELCGLSEPGLSEPGLSEPGLSEPGLSEPGLSEPGLSEPGLAERVVGLCFSCFV